ncbi:uncharacterized protein LOC126766790 [Bactrocera neohumeralis]|uniref:uncharacterized protein LOC126766790 n=1 Tax=Bactrocera neohumeralis TaxID=98809 RepID=UPI002164F230|nr:uncharacterized protein LOC126766790 [Bactrocera neohumeralis]
MAFHGRWPAPRLLLLLAALALLVGGAAASQEVTSSTTMPSGQQYDTFVFTISPDIPKNRETVRLSVPQPTITGGGLTLTGWAEHSLKGEYVFVYAVDGATITDSSLIITGAIPADGTVVLRNTQARSAIPMPVFDFSTMSFTGNVSVTVQGSNVQYSGVGVDAVVVQVGEADAPALVTDYSFLQVLGMRVSGGSCVLSIVGGNPEQSVATVIGNAAVALDVVEADGLSRAALCVEGAVIVSLNSAARVTRSQLKAATLDGVKRSPKLAIDVSAGKLTVISASMFVVKNVSIPDGGVLGSTGGALLTLGSVNLDSIIAIIGIDAKTFCPSCTVDGFPSSQDKSSYVYAQDWTIDGRPTTDYSDQARRRDGPHKRAWQRWQVPVRVLPPRQLEARRLELPQCGCNCKDGSFLPMCLNKEDKSLTYQTCSDVHCVDCGTANGAGCKQCLPNYDLDASGRCVVVKCEVEHCTKCTTDDAGVCAKCEAGYGLVGGKCQACGVNYCTSCDGDTSLCNACFSGFTLSVDRKSCVAAGHGVQRDELRQVRHRQRVPVRHLQGGLRAAFHRPVLPVRGRELQDVRRRREEVYGVQQRVHPDGSVIGTCSPGGMCKVPNCAQCRAGNVNVCQRCVNGYDVNPASGRCVVEGSCPAKHCWDCALGNPNFAWYAATSTRPTSFTAPTT